MALQKTMSYKGASIQDAYIKVSRFNGNKIHLYFEIDVKSSADASEPVYSMGYTADYNANGSNALTQAYEYLKTLPEFSGATDV